MAAIAAWGGIVFKVTENKAVPITAFKESSSSKIATHDCMARRQKIQWIQYNAGTLDLTVVFDSMICRKPYAEYMKLKALEGYTSPLLIGNKRIGYHRWMLTGVSGNYSRIITKGAISRIETTLKFTEYYDDGEA